MTERYDLAVIGAGSGGLTAASFAARLGASVLLIEKNRIGGDCTWTGCVPSKALLKAAKVAHDVRTAAHYGIAANAPVVSMAGVREYVRGAIQQVYRFESPEELQRKGVDVVMGPAKFLDANTISVDGGRFLAGNVLVTTGARPTIPAIASLNDVAWLTYEDIFDNERLPGTMLVVGGGPLGVEIAQAYRRLGAQVTLVADSLLPKDEPEARDVIGRVLAREGIHFVAARALSARNEGNSIVVATAKGEVQGDMLMLAAGRRPTVEGLDLEKAGIEFSAKGIPVDDHLRTNVRNIYAAGDVVGGPQFTHFAGWQAFQAVRNALLPGAGSGFTDLVPHVTFTDPEVAQVGMTEAMARRKFGDGVIVCRREMDAIDRAVCENDTDGFIKLVMREDGIILGATIVAGRAGEAITELSVAIKQGLKATDLAGVIHPYPTYSTAIQQMAADLAIDSMLSGISGRLVRGLSKLVR